ncbi:NHLP bacteriocin export ABC transporter permease/ATPase subunit [Thermoleptolyngbya sp. M55_K2018_002]|uniref:NHLP bacteriocin export ABC transporter permease/ATPase subunit n=1 Tax=Thermoleptolyngbya sp. M55_K2018_002 TaxID=2747808 RepID=UPI0019EB766D|nr:NHLP bacteriocin export ABC transporter permease/ATPase subunit [Thermoleptolyngbya sp. M55_K2018_002]HIK42952.1 NHLP bacteriocin export ABC transporter permease/ATPase subunit [Thermoleptolyngbya sp. M55_K2018_002]
MLAEERKLERVHPTRSLHGNEPLLLDHQTVWQVQSGSLALFAVPMQDGIPRGRRRYLFSVNAGEAVFAADAAEFGEPGLSQPCQQPYQLMAVALEETDLTGRSPAEFLQWLHDEPQAAQQQLEGWVHQLGTTLASMTATILPTPLDRYGVLGMGEVFQPAQGAVTWVRVLQGTALLQGVSSLPLELGVWLPLERHLWLQASDIVELETCTSDAQSAIALMTGLSHLQAKVMQGIQRLEAQEQHQELARYRERQQLNTEAVTRTLDELSTVFDAAPTSLEHTLLGHAADVAIAMNPETALLAAAGAVGRALGIAISPPGKSEDLRRLKDPIEAIARASHIRIRRVTLRQGWWHQDGGPLLAYSLEDGRPVALLPRSASRYELLDPLRQTRTICDARAAETLAPTAYTFYRPLPPLAKPLALLKFALRGHFKELWVVLLAGLGATLLGMVTPQATALLIDQAIPDANRSLLLQIALGLLATAIGATLFQITQSIALMRLETVADASTQAAVWDRLLALRLSFFRQYSIGDLSARVSAVSQIRQKLGNTILKSWFSGIFSLLNLGLLFYYSPPLAAIALLVALINIGVTVISSILTLRKARPLLDRQGKLQGIMREIINGVAKFRVAGAETRAFAYWGRQYSQQLKLTLASQGIEDNLAVINNLLSALTPAVLFAFAVQLLQQSQSQDGSFSIGTFLAFNAAFGTFIGGATSLSTTVVDVMEVLPIWQRALPILHAVPEVADDKADPGRLTGQVSVDRAVFRYREDGPLTLDNVSIHAEPGEFIALVGPSGSGKSTLFRLLLGFDTPESGTVYYDGQDLSGLDMQAVRRQLGVVLQNSRLMSASIFENIASGALIGMEEAWEAARMAGLADDVQAMPMGMHTVVSEGGTNLSGGQRQRLLIARALALRPRILLFDEATSALDNRTQAIVSESLDCLRVTRIVVAHRLSTIRNADRIYVLQNGRVMQKGDFEALATQPGLFSQLIQRQRV